jgi:hypothetical protein
MTQKVMGHALFTLKDNKHRTLEERDKWNKWCGCLKWYLAMLRVGYKSSFSCNICTKKYNSLIT